MGKKHYNLQCLVAFLFGISFCLNGEFAQALCYAVVFQGLGF